MSTTTEEKKPGSPKGVKKPRRVFGRQTKAVDGTTYHFTFQADGLHSKPKHSKTNPEGVNPRELILGFPDLIHPAHTITIDGREYTFTLNAKSLTIKRDKTLKVFYFEHLVDEFEQQFRLPLVAQDPEVEALQKLAKAQTLTPRSAEAPNPPAVQENTAIQPRLDGGRF